MPLSDLTKWLTKSQAAAALSCSEQTIERYARLGRLSNSRRGQKGTAPIAVYNPADVERIRVEDAKPLIVQPPAPPARVRPDHFAEPPAIAEAAPPSGLYDLAKHLVTLATHYAPVPVYVTDHEAAKLTGLSHHTIRKIAADEPDRIATMKYKGGIKYRRADLEAL